MPKEKSGANNQFDLLLILILQLLRDRQHYSERSQSGYSCHFSYKDMLI